MRSLQDSINEYGILTPLVVERISENKYKLIDGRSRIGCIPEDADVPCYILGENSGTVMINKKDIQL